MERYYRMVIDLYKEATNENYQVNSERILDTQKELAIAITTAKIEGRDTEILELLKCDVEHLKYKTL